MYSRKGKRGISWYSDFYIEGRRYKRCWGPVSKSIAKEKEGALKRDIRKGSYEEAVKKVLFEKLNEKLTKALKEVIERNPENNPYVFASHKTSKPFVEIKNGFSAAVKRIGLEGFRFHDLRHTWCSRMCELGIDEATIMKIGGWKTRRMINRYSHISIEHMREVLERLSSHPN